MSKAFRLQSKRIMLTYKSHLEKKEYILWFEDNISTTTFLRLAHESGDKETPYEHTHVVIEFETVFNTRNERIFDYKDIHPNISKILNVAAFKKAKEYIAKEDIENVDLLGKPNVFNLVQKCDTVQEALSLATKFSDATGIITMYNNKCENLLTRYNYSPSMPWQETLIKEMEQVPDSRTINWIIDLVGNSGKTALAKWLTITEPNKWLIVKDMGTSRDASTIIQNAINNGWKSWGIIIDLPRTAQQHKRIYSYIEDIKDGFVTSQKYSGKTMVFDNPHVYVMANWGPDIRCLSKDRWNIRQLLKTKELIQTDISQYVNNECEENENDY